MTGNTITISGTPTTAGTYSGITFAGTDATGAPINGGPFTITINLATTTTALTFTPANWPLNQVVTFTATVAAPNHGVPTGSVAFIIDGNPVSANLNAPVWRRPPLPSPARAATPSAPATAATRTTSPAIRHR